MAGALTEKQLAQHVYTALQAASCPLVEGLHLQEADSMLQLLCTPSQHRTDILTWICSSINPNFANLTARSKDPDVLTKEMAMLGQELMLCKADNLDLIKGDVSPRQQLQFLEQLITPGCRRSAMHRVDTEMLLNEIFANDSLPHLTQMLKPSLDPWPANIKALRKGTKSSCHKPTGEEGADVAALLKSTQSVLEQLQPERFYAHLQCESLNNEAQSPGVFPPNALHVAVRDLQQLMSTFRRVYETNLRAYCNRDPPSFSTEADVFQRVHQLLLACNTELEMLSEVSEASVSMSEEVSQLQTQPHYWSGREKRTLLDQLEELTRRYRDFLAQLHS
ncbi:HAUS augmin-like complex subunit 7 [Thunnus thynnus]|uniref:HAUS augmin-like complex subunit 7 n=1 Tax=Thunnus maccoyii TaxID=8240 RepID=UPI001C4D0D22|nr:HAUS augmin-like complex subunit 7 [Thunnus maccoyii]